MQAESPITVACIQMEPKIGEKKANVAHSLDKIAEAAGKGARLIVLPELCNSGYVFASRHEAFTLAEPVSKPMCTASRLMATLVICGPTVSTPFFTMSSRNRAVTMTATIRRTSAPITATVKIRLNLFTDNFL